MDLRSTGVQQAPAILPDSEELCTKTSWLHGTRRFKERDDQSCADTPEEFVFGSDSLFKCLWFGAA
jgi:hypothetical protein